MGGRLAAAAAHRRGQRTLDVMNRKRLSGVEARGKVCSELSAKSNFSSFHFRIGPGFHSLAQLFGAGLSRVRLKRNP